MVPARRPLALALVALLGAALAAPARADQPSTEAEVATPAPEPAPAETQPEPSEGASVTIPPAGPPLSAEPIEPVHRPRGFWGPVAVAADLLVMRPIGFVSLAAGGAAFVVVSPAAAATGTLGDRADTLWDRTKNVFTRPLGAL